MPKLTPILTEDSKGRGFTGYLFEFPEIFAQGKDKEEVERNLLISLNDIMEFRKEQELFKIGSKRIGPSPYPDLG